jgi:hypothetical protein
MARAPRSISKTSKIIHILRKDRAKAEVLLTRHLARKEIKAQWKRMGKQITAVDETALAKAVTVYLIEHRSRLRTEARLILSSNEREAMNLIRGE